MTNIDFRDQEPVWVTYLINTSAGHNKYYEARIDMDDNSLFVLTKRWGARPDRGVGQIKAEPYRSLGDARTAANDILIAKRRKGYRDAERPEQADSKVARVYAADDDPDEDYDY
jgi:predicted DNA-binding WGR domain protein